MRKLAELQSELVARTRLGMPAIAHEECLTGFTTLGATVFPTPLALAATFDVELVEAMATRIGEGMRAVGVHQGLSPVLDVVRDYRWGRVEETFGEDPYLVGALGAAYVRGLEATGIVATLKHFAGYSASRSGRNLGPAPVGPRELQDVLLPPFERAVRDGARSVMHSYSEVDGVPAAADARLLTGVLRDEWGFAGVVVADYWGIAFLQSLHRVAGSPAEAGAKALAAGVDVELPRQHLLSGARRAGAGGRARGGARGPGGPAGPAPEGGARAARRRLGARVDERRAGRARPTREPRDRARARRALGDPAPQRRRRAAARRGRAHARASWGRARTTRSRSSAATRSPTTCSRTTRTCRPAVEIATRAGGARRRAARRGDRPRARLPGPGARPVRHRGGGRAGPRRRRLRRRRRGPRRPVRARDVGGGLRRGGPRAPRRAVRAAGRAARHRRARRHRGRLGAPVRARPLRAARRGDRPGVLPRPGGRPAPSRACCRAACAVGTAARGDPGAARRAAGDLSAPAARRQQRRRQRDGPHRPVSRSVTASRTRASRYDGLTVSREEVPTDGEVEVSCTVANAGERGGPRPCSCTWGTPSPR